MTISWFVLALIAYGFFCIGRVWTFLLGTVLIFLKMVLDIADGEIGRAQGGHLDKAEDASRHLRGIYLDRVQHAVESPIWGMTLGLGTYRLTGDAWMVLCGMCVSAARVFWIAEPLVRRYRQPFASEP
ncbi:MAG: hypothetical protein GXP27_10060 [Planctomycetes bacterium]|nr:hypothetical protein [Planctomycetota bacterium]